MCELSGDHELQCRSYAHLQLRILMHSHCSGGAHLARVEYHRFVRCCLHIFGEGFDPYHLRTALCLVVACHRRHRRVSTVPSPSETVTCYMCKGPRRHHLAMYSTQVIVCELCSDFFAKTSLGCDCDHLGKSRVGRRRSCENAGMHQVK